MGTTETHCQGLHLNRDLIPPPGLTVLLKIATEGGYSFYWPQALHGAHHCRGPVKVTLLFLKEGVNQHWSQRCVKPGRQNRNSKGRLGLELIALSKNKQKNKGWRENLDVKTTLLKELSLIPIIHRCNYSDRNLSPPSGLPEQCAHMGIATHRHTHTYLKRLKQIFKRKTKAETGFLLK